MSGLDTFVYYLTAPIRVFGRSPYVRWGIVAACIVGVFFVGTLWLLNRVAPRESGFPEALAIMQPPKPLEPVTRASHVIAPVEVALTAIGQALDGAGPRAFAGKNDNPVTQLLGQAQIGLTVSRGTMTASGQPGVLTVTTPLNGSIRVTGQIGNSAGKMVGGIGGTIGGLLCGSGGGNHIKKFACKTLH